MTDCLPLFLADMVAGAKAEADEAEVDNVGADKVEVDNAEADKVDVNGAAAILAEV